MLERDLQKIPIGDADGALLATRTEAVVGRIQLSGGDCIDPESFQRGLYPHWGILTTRYGERFLLTERSFQSRIDGFFNGLPSRLIRFYLSQGRFGETAVLDVGGGRDAKAAREIACLYPGVRVTSLDIVAVNEKAGNFTSCKADICASNLPDKSFDLIYSHQVLPYLGFERRVRAIEEICRILKPGGSAVIDLADSLCVSGVLEAIGRGFNGQASLKSKSYGGVFLFIVQEPIDPAVLKIGSAVPDWKV